MIESYSEEEQIEVARNLRKRKHLKIVRCHRQTEQRIQNLLQRKGYSLILLNKR